MEARLAFLLCPDPKALLPNPEHPLRQPAPPRAGAEEARRAQCQADMARCPGGGGAGSPRTQKRRRSALMESY